MLLTPSPALQSRLRKQLVLETLLTVAGPEGFSGQLAGGSKERSSLMLLHHQEISGHDAAAAAAPGSFKLVVLSVPLHRDTSFESA